VYVTHDQDEALTMSDRLAVFSHGKIEQVGSPAEVYERPATSFVAGFVGVSNTLSGQVAREIVGSDATFTIRPEKIRMLAVDEQPGPGMFTVTGHVRAVIYLGASTRYAVALDPGGELVVLQQNLTQSSMEALEVQGKPVRLAWDRANNRVIQELRGETEPSGSGEEEG
jgi:putative spermidine/putrescine transport system ATP-binding protein